MFVYQAMQSNAAVFRTGPVLQEGIEKLEGVYSDMKHIKVDTHDDSFLYYCMAVRDASL